MSDQQPVLSCATQGGAPPRARRRSAAFALDSVPATRRSVCRSPLRPWTRNRPAPVGGVHPAIRTYGRLPYACHTDAGTLRTGRKAGDSVRHAPHAGPDPAPADLSVIQVANHLTVPAKYRPVACCRFCGHRDTVFQRNRSFPSRDGTHHSRLDQSFPDMPLNAMASI
jgi:hypothetical protein